MSLLFILNRRRSGGFSIFDGARVELENYGDSPSLTDPQQVSTYSRAFEHLARGAVYGGDARAVIQAELRTL